MVKYKYPKDKFISKTTKKNLEKRGEFIAIQSLPTMSIFEHCEKHIKAFLNNINLGTSLTTVDLTNLFREIDNGRYGKGSDKLKNLIQDYYIIVNSDNFLDHKKLYSEILGLANSLCKNKIQESQTLTNFSKGDTIVIKSVNDFMSKLPSDWYGAITANSTLENLFSRGGKLVITVTEDDAHTLTGLEVDIQIIGDMESRYISVINDLQELFTSDEESLMVVEDIFESSENFDYHINIVGGIIGTNKNGDRKSLMGIYGLVKELDGSYIVKGKNGEFVLSYMDLNSGFYDVISEENINDNTFVKGKTYKISDGLSVKSYEYIGKSKDNFIFVIDDRTIEFGADKLKGLNSEIIKPVKLQEKMNSDYKTIYDKVNSISTAQSDYSMYDRKKDKYIFNKSEYIIEISQIVNMMSVYGYTEFDMDNDTIMFTKP